MDEPGLIRSYQRIFRPERRLYQIEGRSLPVPGGVPLRWLGWATGTLLAVLVLSGGSATVALLAAGAAALAGGATGGRETAIAAAVLALGAVPVVGWLLGVVDWPLRLVVVPALVATLVTQATPDGRRADRFAWSWLALRLAPRRRSLGRALPPTSAPRVFGGELWVAPDEHAPGLRRSRLSGPAQVRFAAPVRAVRGRLRSRRLVIRPLHASRLRRRGAIVDSLALERGETAVVRP